MANESLNNGWHTFPDEPDTWEDVETVYLVCESYDVKNKKGVFKFECYQGFCLWDWENHRFIDIFGGEYFYGAETSLYYENHKLFWKSADLPPGMEKYADKIYESLCRQGVRPFSEPDYDPYDDPDQDRKWKEMHGE